METSVAASQLSYIEGMGRRDPSWSSLARYMQNPELTGVLTFLIEESAAPFRSVEEVLAVDSTGFSTSVKQSWNEYRYGNSVRSAGDTDHERLRREPTTITRYVKAHIASGARTNVVTAVIVTAEESGDAPQLPALIAKTAQRFRLKQVLADKAYLAQYNLDAIHGLGAVPLIPMKSNSRLHDGTDEATKLWNGLYHFL